MSSDQSPDWSDTYDADYDVDDAIVFSDLNSIALKDPEDVEYRSLSPDECHRMVLDQVRELAEEHGFTPSTMKVLLLLTGWDASKLVTELNTDRNKFLIESGILPSLEDLAKSLEEDVDCESNCGVCYESGDELEMHSLKCGHSFCNVCWPSYIQTQVENGLYLKIKCMQDGCSVICPEDFVLSIIEANEKLSQIRSKFKNGAVNELIVSNSRYGLCPGPDCDHLCSSDSLLPHRVCCKACNTTFCKQCLCEYHAPLTCDLLKQWKIKCSDDSETLNYFKANTKDCPKCHTAIEKNGGCNHISCTRCKHEFCWLCFADYHRHQHATGGCTRYKEGEIAPTASTARKSLERYLHYFQRFEAHQKSLQFEETQKLKVQTQIEDNIEKGNGTWIDWQHLHDAAHILTRCRYTLQYTYPFAFFLEEDDQRRTLFEYQQAELEKEIESLAWKMERVETTTRQQLEAQSKIAEKMRQNLLQDFFT